MGTYAEKTSVSISKTKADLEEMIIRAGAEQFVSGYKENTAMIGFAMANRQIRFILPLPDRHSEEFWVTPAGRKRRTADAAYAAWEQACRSRWRALYLIVKAKLEAVETGISTIEREFFYDVVLPDGKTVGEWMAPQLETVYQTGDMPSMLPELEDKDAGINVCN